MEKISIDATNMPISHITYRTTSIQEHEDIRDQLKLHCKEFVETQFNGRSVSILNLRTPLPLSKGFSFSFIELPAPRAEHMYPSGLEHVGFLVGEALSEFKDKHKGVLTGEKDRRPYCFPAYVTFENGKTAKFYEKILKEIVALQGWSFEKL